MPEGLSLHVSQSVALRAAAADPENAPAGLREAAAALGSARVVARREAAAGGPQGNPRAPRDLFTFDTTGLPQNEESVNACRADPSVVLGGTNDYRGLTLESADATGWHFSSTSGRTLTNEGQLPPVSVFGTARPSSGDPVVAIDETDCSLYMANLNVDPVDPFGSSNGVGVYRSDAATLASCPGGDEPSCWPTRRAVAASPNAAHFLDKEWMDVGTSGAAGKVVWITYSDFANDPNAPLGFTGASIKAVRCKADLSGCSAPILISGSDKDVQFSYVTIGADGRTYVTWSEIQGELEQTAQTFVHKMRVAEPGSTSFGPTRTIYSEDLAIPFGGKLHAEDFRVATVLKNDVAMVNGKPRVFVVWDACSERALDTVCIEPQIKLSWSDDLGATWTGPTVVSVNGDNYFPSISQDGAGRLAVAYFTNRYDRQFHNRQDVELRSVSAATGRVGPSARRLTNPSNEPEADPILGGLFIGDYIQVYAHKGIAWTHYNANYRQVPLLGATSPIPQQDNYLARTGF